jgi:hypothetical protein
MHKVFSAISDARIDLDLFEGSVIVKRTTGMEKEIGIAHRVHATV